jgi:hypothetical protein
MHELIQKFHAGVLSSKFSIRDEILLYKEHLYIGPTLRETVLQFIYSSSVAGHAGYDKTIHKARKDFYWPGLKSDIKKFRGNYLFPP